MARGTRGIGGPSVRQAMTQGAVNVPNVSQRIWNPLYDYQTYNGAAGHTLLQFFAVPAGSGGKTKNDTNMTLAGQLPAGQSFLITGVQVEFYPGLEINQTNAGAAVNDYANDVMTVYNNLIGAAASRLVLTIGAKDYIEQAPLNKFPPVNRLVVDDANATTAAATGLVSSYACASGREFAIDPLNLVANQDFSVTLHNLPILPSAANGRIGVTLNGYLYRNAQ